LWLPPGFSRHHFRVSRIAPVPYNLLIFTLNIGLSCNTRNFLMLGALHRRLWGLIFGSRIFQPLNHSPRFMGWGKIPVIYHTLLSFYGQGNFRLFLVYPPGLFVPCSWGSQFANLPKVGLARGNISCLEETTCNNWSLLLLLWMFYLSLLGDIQDCCWRGLVQLFWINTNEKVCLYRKPNFMKVLYLILDCRWVRYFLGFLEHS